MPAHGYAQTPLQLQAQLAAAGWDAADLGAQADAQALARDLFSARFRATGKSLLAHLNGTASIAAAHGGDRPAVLAALLHAAYDQGDFGDGLPGPAPAHRTELRAALGPETEALLAAYAAFHWKPWLPPTSQHAPPPTGRLADLDATGRTVLFLRACNALEDTLDGALSHCGGDKRVGALRHAEAAAGLARQLGHAALADELDAAHAAVQAAPEPPDGTPARSYTVVPRSLRRRPRRWLRWRRAPGDSHDR